MDKERKAKQARDEENYKRIQAADAAIKDRVS